jgi:hypothetical protein
LFFDFLFYGKFPGVSFPLYVVLILAGLGGITLLYGRQIGRDVLWLAAPLLFFAIMVSVRASFLLTFLNIAAVILLLLIIAQVSFSESLRKYRESDYMKLFFLPFMSLIAMFKSLGDLITFKGVKQDKRNITQTIMGMVIAVPLIGVFLALFMSADLVFRRALSQIVDINIGPEFVVRTILILFFSFCFIAAYSFIFRKAEKGVGYPIAVPVEGNTGVFGSIDSSIILGSVNALFLVFILFQLAYLFGGSSNISVQGFTYAEYARRGFFELVAVAAIALVMLVLIERFITKREKGHTVLFKVLSTTLVVQVMVIMASSLTRMSLYENAYGFTEMRLYVHVFIFFIAAVYLVLLHKIHLDNRENVFTFKVFLLLVAFLAIMNGLNPDGFVARQNMERFKGTGKIDAAYLGSLSDDALPVTISLLDAKDDKVRTAYASNLKETETFEKKPLFSRWQSLNLSRYRARDLLQGQDL